jgi:hypothetical protein
MSKVNLTSSPFLIVIIVGGLLLAHWVTGYFTNKMGQLPIEGAQHAARTPSITPDTRIYPLLAETKARITTQETASLEVAFTRALVKPVVPPPPPPEPLKPTPGDIFKENTHVSAIAGTGAYINGRYYQVGDRLNSKVKMVGANNCTVLFTVGIESVTLLTGNCNKDRKKHVK